MPRAHRSTLLLLLVAGCLTSCGLPSPAAASPPVSPPASPLVGTSGNQVCALLSAAEVRAATGVRVRVGRADKVSRCMWAAVDHGHHAVTLDVQALGAKQDMATFVSMAVRANLQPVPITGLGEGAFGIVGTKEEHSYAVKDGELLGVYVGRDARPASSVALARVVYRRI